MYAGTTYYGQAQQGQGQQQHSYYSNPPQQTSTYFSIDVECVATGTDHNARSVAQIALVDQNCNVLLNAYVKPDRPVVSYLTPLTGLSRQILDQYGVSLQQAIQGLRTALPKHAVLVGQNINKDVQWLGLREGEDFASMVDLAGIYRVYNPQYGGWSIYGQDHVARVLLGWGANAAGQSEHSAVQDALKSMALFAHYNNYLKDDPAAMQHAQQALMSTPQEPSFAKRNPTFEGVCMGQKRTCSCGAAFLSS